MIIGTALGEKHKHVLHLQFGSGDIMFTKVKMDDDSYGLVFAEKPGKAVGEESNEYAGKNVDDFNEEIKVLMTFSNPESATAVIHSLVEIQQAIFDKKL
jgi:predicted CoA-binding protein